MRTVMLFGFFMLQSAIVYASGRPYIAESDDLKTIIFWLLLSCIVMDIVEFLKKITSK